MHRTSTLVDSFGRRVTTLRISLTDRCNFRCVYCMPPEGVPLIPKSTFLSTEQIVRFARVAGTLGVTRYRLTGGEPLLRRDVVSIVEALRRVDTVEELSITTNGSQLAELAGPLKRAGLDRLNVSLDSLDAGRFERVTLFKHYERVRAGIDAALREGFPVKVNVVVLAGIPAEEILGFAQMAVDHDMDVRFLEFMPLCGTGWRPDLVYPIAKVREIVRNRFELEALPRGSAPAETFQIAGGRGRVGFIAPLSEPFCESCARIRISADGKIRPCLFSSYEVDMAPYLEPGVSDERLQEQLRRAVWNKPAGSQFADDPFHEASSAPVTTGPAIRSIGG